MQQNYYIALRTDDAKGSGTEDDPWNGSTQALFDQAMNAVPQNSTVFLGPCKFDSNGSPTHVFETKGYPTVDGFTPKSGQRIVGAGRDVTHVKLVGQFDHVQTSVFGIPLKPSDYMWGNLPNFLYGFELSDLTIDANLPAGSTYAAAAVNITGKHILLTRIRAKNYGSNKAGLDCTVLSPARASIDCPIPPYDCIIEDCIVDPPSAQHSQRAYVFALLTEPDNGVMFFHDVCVIRNNFLNGGYTSTSGPDVVAFSAVGANAGIIEQNRIKDCKYGGPHFQSSTSGIIKDLIVRDNLYLNVRYGISFADADADRLIVEDNLIDVFPDVNAYGMLLTGTTLTYSLDTLVVRGNRIRGVNNQPLLNGSYGIYVGNTGKATIENNIVNSLQANPAEAVRVTNCASVQVFNNQRINGDLARVLNLNTGLYLHELATDAEDVFLSL